MTRLALDDLFDVTDEDADSLVTEPPCFDEARPRRRRPSGPTPSAAYLQRIAAARARLGRWG